MRCFSITTALLLASTTLGKGLKLKTKRDILSSVQALQDSVSYLNCQIGYGLKQAVQAISPTNEAIATCVAPAILVQTTATPAPVPTPVSFVTVTAPGFTQTCHDTTIMGATSTVTFTPAAVTITSTAVVTSFVTQTATNTQSNTVTSTSLSISTSTAPGPASTNPCFGKTAGTISVNYQATGLGLGSLISAGSLPPGYISFSSDISQTPMQFNLTAGLTSSGIAFKILITSGGKGGTYLGALDAQGGGASIGGNGPNYAWLQEMIPGNSETSGTYDQSSTAYGTGQGESFVWKQVEGLSCQLIAVWQNGNNGVASGAPVNPGYFYDQTANQVGISDANSFIMTSSPDTTIPIYLTFLPNSV